MSLKIRNRNVDQEVVVEGVQGRGGGPGQRRGSRAEEGV
jgi:hypothetical protein